MSIEESEEYLDKYTTISVKRKTKKDFTSICKKEETYDDLLKRLIEKEKREMNESHY